MSEVEAIVYTEERVYPFYSKVVRRYIPFSEAILMQSTGAMDSTGEVEIYEGDILLYDDEEYDGGSIYAIVRFVYNGLYLAIDNGISNNLALGLSNYKVVGNKYENKDLEKKVYNQW